ncbi:MAG: radical SAM protein [Desulfobacterales bacterium]
MLEKIDGVQPHSIFFKNFYTNAVTPPTAREETLLRELIVELNPKIVGISVYSPFVSTAIRISNIVKYDSSALVVWGGIHPTLSPQHAIREADILCIGEGEGALTDLVVSLRDGNGYHHIDNLWVKKDAAVIKNPMRPLIQDLDSLPYPAYARDTFHFIANDSVTITDPALLNPILSIMPARGCQFACSYCVNSLLRPMYKNLGPYGRRRSVRNIIDEMKQILSIPANKKEIVEFHDENFGTDERWLKEFEQFYPAEIGLPFKIQYNPVLIKASTIGKLEKCGLRRLKFGIESGTDQIRNQIFARRGKNKDIINLIKGASEYEVKLRYDLILDNPYDTAESLKETIRFILQLPKPRWFNLFSLQYFPDYPLTRKALQDGHIAEKDASLDTLEMRMARNWGYVPKFFPFTLRQIFQNIIWLMAYRDPDDEAIEEAIRVSSLRSKFILIVLNLKSIFWGKINTFKRLMYKKIY